MAIEIRDSLGGRSKWVSVSCIYVTAGASINVHGKKRADIVWGVDVGIEC